LACIPATRDHGPSRPWSPALPSGGASCGITATSLLVTAAALPHVTGSPGPGVLRRLRPTGPFSGRRAYPRLTDRTSAAREPAPGGSRVHCDSLAGVGARLYPSGIATLAPQAFSVASRSGGRIPSRSSRRAARGRTHRTQPISARFELVSCLKDVTTPVSRVLLSVTLAGPAPSGSTGHVPALSGLLPPSPAPPGSGCPQLHQPAATSQRQRSLTSTRTTAPHGADDQHDNPPATTTLRDPPASSPGRARQHSARGNSPSPARQLSGPRPSTLRPTATLRPEHGNHP